jgi:hypothetical protein
MGPLGYLGLVWADSAKQMGHALIMLAAISWQVGMRRQLVGQGTLWILAAGLGAGFVTWVFAMALDGVMAAGLGHDLAQLLVAGGGGLAIYLLLLQWARLPELAAVNSWLWQRLGRG